MHDAHPHRRGLSALRSPPIEMIISAGNSLTDTLRNNVQIWACLASLMDPQNQPSHGVPCVCLLDFAWAILSPGIPNPPSPPGKPFLYHCGLCYFLPDLGRPLPKEVISLLMLSLLCASRMMPTLPFLHLSRVLAARSALLLQSKGFSDSSHSASQARGECGGHAH